MQLILSIVFLVAVITLFVCTIGALASRYHAVSSTSDWMTVYSRPAIYRRRMWIFIAVSFIAVVTIITIGFIAAQNGWNIYPTEI